MENMSCRFILQPNLLFLLFVKQNGLARMKLCSKQSVICMAGVAGIEPAAFGFGDRRSSQLSYTPMQTCLAGQRYCSSLFALFVLGILTAVLAKLIQQQAIGSVFGIFTGRVIAVVALGALQCNKRPIAFRHYISLLYGAQEEI